MNQIRLQQEITDNYIFVKLIKEIGNTWEGRVVRFPKPKVSGESNWGESLDTSCNATSEEELQQKLNEIILKSTR